MPGLPMRRKSLGFFPKSQTSSMAMLWAAASRESGNQLRCEPHGVEVPPTPFIGIFSKAAVAAAFRPAPVRNPPNRATKFPEEPVVGATDGAIDADHGEFLA
ncbi:MAG: hypothetical protein WEB53_16605, partial [Akkermansiaceae bacterium]